MKEKKTTPAENKPKTEATKEKVEAIKHKSVYWSEPEQLSKTSWEIKKFNTAGEKIEQASFKSKQDAWNYLKTINIYIDGKLVHSSI